MKYLPITLLIVGLCFMPSFAQNWTAEQKEILEFQDRCYGGYEDKDRSDCFHPDYVGWYSENPVPMPFDERFEKYYRETAPMRMHSLKPHNIIVKGNVAIVHYSGLSIAENAEGKMEESWQHWTDILIKENGKWAWIADHGHPEPK